MLPVSMIMNGTLVYSAPTDSFDVYDSFIFAVSRSCYQSPDTATHVWFTSSYPLISTQINSVPIASLANNNNNNNNSISMLKQCHK
jgi:hypothetical protein